MWGVFNKMKNLAEELEFGKIDTEIEVKPLVLVEKSENITEDSKNVLKVLWKYIYAIIKRFVDILAGIAGCL